MQTVFQAAPAAPPAQPQPVPLVTEGIEYVEVDSIGTMFNELWSNIASLPMWTAILPVLVMTGLLALFIIDS